MDIYQPDTGDQRTEEWLEERRGKISATHMSDILMKPDKAGYRNYLMKLALERLTGKSLESWYCNADMQRGIDLEPIARELYEFETGRIVEQLMWVDHPTIPMSGCSPDGSIMGGDAYEGGVETKCPKPATHADYLLTEEVDRGYRLQMLWQMECQGLQWIDFVSYCPEFPENLQLKVIRFNRDEEEIGKLKTAAVDFNRAVERMVEELRAL